MKDSDSVIEKDFEMVTVKDSVRVRQKHWEKVKD